MKTHDLLIVLCDNSADILEGMATVEDFQFVQLVTGHAFVSVGECLYFLQPGDMFFSRPGTSCYWLPSPDAMIHLCAVSPEYLQRVPEIAVILEDLPVFNSTPALTGLSDRESSLFCVMFRMIREEAGNGPEKDPEAIEICLRLMILYIGRVLAPDNSGPSQLIRPGSDGFFASCSGHY